jgi:hypothetical protein
LRMAFLSQQNPCPCPCPCHQCFGPPSHENGFGPPYVGPANPCPCHQCFPVNVWICELWGDKVMSTWKRDRERLLTDETSAAVWNLRETNAALDLEQWWQSGWQQQ